MSEIAPDNENPELHLDLGGETFIATPNNCFLYTFMGKTVINGLEVNNEVYDHVILVHETEEGNIGELIYSENPAFERIFEHMIRNDYSMVLNQRVLSEGELAKYEGYIQRTVDTLCGENQTKIPDCPPEEWPESEPA